MQLNPVQFMFMPINPAQSKRLAATCPHAVVQGDGSFRLTTYRTNDGAGGNVRPYGDVARSAAAWREEGPDRLQGRYSDRRRPVSQVQIVAGENDLGTIRLK